MNKYTTGYVFGQIVPKTLEFKVQAIVGHSQVNLVLEVHQSQATAAKSLYDDYCPIHPGLAAPREPLFSDTNIAVRYLTL